MSKTISLIQRVQIASPCTADWNAMTGDERVRFCDQCKLNVYNLSEMSERDAEKLIIEKEGKLCARIYRRRDGTVITRDCPLGWKAIRRKTLRLCVQTAAALLAIAGATAATVSPQRRVFLPGGEENYHRPIELFYLEPDMFSWTAGKMRQWLDDDSSPFAVAGAMAPLNPPRNQK